MHESIGLAVDQHGARAAVALVAALLGAGEAEVVAQHLEQRGARACTARSVTTPFPVRNEA